MPATRLGSDVRMKYDTNNTGGATATWTELPNVTSIKFGKKDDKVDATVFGDNGWTSEIIAGQGITFTIEGSPEPTNAVYTALFDASMATAPADKLLWFQLDRSGIDAANKYEFQAYVSMTEDYSLKALAKYTCELAMQGAPTISTPVSSSSSSASPSASASASPSSSASASPSSSSS